MPPLADLNESDMSDAAPNEPAPKPKAKGKSLPKKKTTPKAKAAGKDSKDQEPLPIADAKGESFTSQLSQASQQPTAKAAPKIPKVKAKAKGVTKKVLKRPSASVSSTAEAGEPQAKPSKKPSAKTEKAYKYQYHALKKYGIKYKNSELLTVPPSFSFQFSIVQVFLDSNLDSRFQPLTQGQMGPRPDDG